MNKVAVALAAAATLLSAGTACADDLVFTLKNATNSVVNSFYTSPVGVKDWEEDVFGEQVLSPGESMKITISDGRRVCKYDMRIEFQGDELEDMEDTQDLCEMSSYTIEE